MTSPSIRPAGRLPIQMLLVAVAALATALPAHADGKPAAHRLGEHPAVVVQRLQRTAGYDFASKFYPHPAHLYLLPASPDELERMRAAALAATIDATPAPVDERHGPVAQR